MQHDKTDIILTWLSAALIVASAVAGLIVLNDVVILMPRELTSYSGEAVSVAFAREASVAIVLTAVVTGSLLGSAGMLLAFVLLRQRIALVKRSVSINRAVT